MSFPLTRRKPASIAGYKAWKKPKYYFFVNSSTFVQKHTFLYSWDRLVWPFSAFFAFFVMSVNLLETLLVTFICLYRNAIAGGTVATCV